MARSAGVSAWAPFVPRLNVAAAASPGASNNYAGRTLRNGTNSLVYNLYTNAARTQIWGNGTDSSLRVTQSFAGLLLVDRTIPVYGRIPARQNVRAGAYSDTIIVTVTY
jgi:spore coat protein U-like protein